MSQSPTEIIPELPNTPSIPESEYHRLLSSERRRILLDVISEDPTVDDLESAAEAIVAREGRTTPSTADAVETVAITLHHTHLPLLADAGVIEYDRESHTIEA